MVVKRLQIFIERYCPPDCCFEVSIKELVEEHRRETDGQQPVIVVDGSSYLKGLYSCESLDWVCGGQFKEYFEGIKKFVDAFKELGVHLVFLFGHLRTNEPEIHDERVATSQEKLKKVYKMFDDLGNGVTTSELDLSLFRTPTNLGLTFYFREFFGCEVRKTLDEAELAHFARENNCLAIFTRDSDLIIHEGGKYVLSANEGKFDLERMRTLAYDRRRLAAFLDLPLSQFPLFATLAGSHKSALRYEYLEAFHRSLCEENEQWWRYEVYFPALAKYVRQLPAGDDIFKVLPTVAQEVFKVLPAAVQTVFNGSTADFAKMLELNIRHYLPIKSTTKFATVCDDPNWNTICREAEALHRKNVSATVILNILRGKPFMYAVATEDFRKNDLPSASKMLRPLRQRSYGILLKEKPANVDPRMVKEWCVEGPDSLESPYLVKPILPSDHHPGLLVLWNDEDRSEETQIIRWKLFSHAISRRLNYLDLLNIPAEHVTLPTATLFYLVEHKVLDSWEIDALLVTIIMLPSAPLDYLKNLSADPVNLRAVQIASIFIRSMVTVIRLLSICGYPFPRSQAFAHPYFDGKLFQEKYRKAKVGATYEELCENQEAAMQIFLLVKEILAKSEIKVCNDTT